MTETPVPRSPAAMLEKVLIGGDLAELSPQERLEYYQQVCESLGLNPLTRPFDYIKPQGKLILYAKKDATDQLRNLHGINVDRLEREVTEGCYVVTAYLSNAAGRKDSELGAVPIDGLRGEARANAMLKAVTKAKRRGTLSICGLGMLDETEVETIPVEALETEPESGRLERPAPRPSPEFEQFKQAFRNFRTTDDDPNALAALWRGIQLPEIWRTLTVPQQVELGGDFNAARKRLGVR